MSEGKSAHLDAWTPPDDVQVVRSWYRLPDRSAWYIDLHAIGRNGCALVTYAIADEYQGPVIRSMTAACASVQSAADRAFTVCNPGSKRCEMRHVLNNNEDARADRKTIPSSWGESLIDASAFTHAPTFAKDIRVPVERSRTETEGRTMTMQTPPLTPEREMIADAFSVTAQRLGMDHAETRERILMDAVLFGCPKCKRDVTLDRNDPVFQQRLPQIGESTSPAIEIRARCAACAEENQAADRADGWQ